MLTTDEWVKRLNALARKIDEWEGVLHPTAWPEQLGELHEQYRRLAALPTYDPPTQLQFTL